MQKFREILDSIQHDMAYGDFKGLTRRTASEYSVIKPLTLLKLRNLMNIKEVLLQWSVNFLIKNFWWSN